MALLRTRTPAHDRAKQAPPREESLLAERFALFAECLLTGVWIALASLPLVTYPAAFAAGSRHLRRRTAHEGGGWREFVADFRSAARVMWRVMDAWAMTMAPVCLGGTARTTGTDSGSMRNRSGKTSAPVDTTPAWRSSTANSIANRPASIPATDRRGIGAAVFIDSACTSTSTGRAPSSTAATAEPGTPGRRSTRKRADASGTSTSPCSVISSNPTSSVPPS